MANWGEAGKGALGGAATGAAVGSAVPGIGTAIGAGVGALAGGLSGLWGGSGESEAEKEAKEKRKQRELLRQRLEAQATGADSLASEQVRQHMLGQQAAAMRMAASASPANRAMATRNALGAMARANYGASGQAALAGIMERKAANEQLAGLLAEQPQAPQKSFMEQWGPAVMGGLEMYARSKGVPGK